MKATKTTALIAAVLISISAVSCSKSPWVAKLDGKKITLDEINLMYYSHLKSAYNVKTNAEIDKLASSEVEKQKNPLLDRETFLNEYIKQRLVYLRAKKEKVTDSDDYKAMVQIQQDSLIAAYYAQKKFESKISVSDQEISDVYNKEKANFKGATLEQATSYIKQQLSQQKLYKESSELLQNLKDKAVLDRNTEVIAALSDPDKSKHPKSGWVCKIDKEEISVKDFESLYYAQLSNAYGVTTRDEIDKFATDPLQVERNPLLSKSKFLEEIIKQRLVSNEAKAEKLLDDPEIKANLQLMEEMTSVWFYVKTKYAKDIEPTDQEVQDVYLREQARFKGVPITSAEQYIKQALKNEKLQAKTQKVINDVKEGTKVEKDLDTLLGVKKEDVKESK